MSFLKSAFVGLALIATASASVAEEGAGAGFSVSLEPRGAEQPSFDCARAKSAAALLICADGELARLDAELGAAFQKRKAEISPAERLKFAADQLAWIRARNTRCALDGKGNAAIEALAIAKPCMVKAIRGRIAFLAQAGSALPPGFVLDQSSRMPGNLLSDSDVGFGGAAAQPQSGSARAPDDWFVPDEGAREECDPDAIPTKYDPLKGVTDSAQREALLDGSAALNSGDYAKALRQFRPLADQGTAAAEDLIGIMYYFGQGVPQGYAEAAKWFRLAAHQGNADAEGWLGDIYYRGLDVLRNYVEAAKWSCPAAKQGYAPSQSLLGFMYLRGNGVKKNDMKALNWFRLAADQGYPDAQTNLGIMYHRGEGVLQDYAEAIKWHRLAANQGNAQAQLLLGGMYFEGQGVTQDYAQAYIWFNLSAAQGFQGAAKARDIVSTFMTPAQIAEAQRLAREWRPNAANASSPESEPQFPSPDRRELEATSGTAFFVAREGGETIKEVPSRENARGIALTNAHVVEDCRQIQVRSGTYSGAGRVVARDDGNDLALLTTDLKPSTRASWRFSIRQGEDIAVYGFPLVGMLAAGGNIATGNVTALAGLRDDSRFLQISAPVQPGNSGGPLLDRNGNVVGIVVAKLDALKVVSATGDIPQNVNFAIKASAAAAFLDAQGVAHVESTGGPTLSTPDIAERAKKLAMQVVCIR